MKKIVFILAIVGLVFTSCGNKKNQNSGTHVHEDGTVHANDAHNLDQTVKPDQESFEVKADNDAEHKHEDTDHEGHEHGDETGHDHGEHK